MKKTFNFSLFVVVFFVLAFVAFWIFWCVPEQRLPEEKKNSKTTTSRISPREVHDIAKLGNDIPAPKGAAAPQAMRSKSSEPQIRQGLDLEVPVGAKVPAALMDAGGQDDGPEIREILDSITNEFIASIERSRLEGLNPEEAWDAALRVADEKYKFFFGQEAFNEASLEAAVEGVEERDAFSGDTRVKTN